MLPVAPCLFIVDGGPLIEWDPHRFIGGKASSKTLVLTHVDCVNRMDLPDGRTLRIRALSVPTRSVTPVEEELPRDTNGVAPVILVEIGPGFRPEVRADLGCQAVASVVISDLAKLDVYIVEQLRSEEHT